MPIHAVFVLFLGSAVAMPQTAPPAPRSSDGAYVEIYDVRDLALSSALRRLLPPEELAPNATRGDGGPAAATSRGESALAKFLLGQAHAKEGARDGIAADFAAWKLMEALVQCVGARGGGGTTCHAEERGTLVVHADGEMHKTIDAVITKVRRADESIPIELRVVELDRQAQELLDGFAAAREAGAGPSQPPLAAPVAAPVSNPTQAEVDRLLAHAGTKVLGAPSVVTPQLDEFEVELAETTAYVASFTLTSIEGIGTISDPVIKEARPGTRVSGRCAATVPSPGGEPALFALRLEVEVSALKKPIATQKTELGTIQLPELRRAMLSTTVAGAADRLFLIGGVPMPAFDDAGPVRRLYVLVKIGTPRRRD